MRGNSFRLVLTIGVALTADHCPAQQHGRGQAPDRHAEGLAIRIRLSGEEVFSRETIRLAEDTTAAILQAAGVHTSWVVCGAGSPLPVSDPCRPPTDPADLQFEFVTRPGTGLDLLSLAYAIPANHSAAIVYPLVKTSAVKFETSEGIVLGVVMAHEVGHLMGIARHAITGIMEGTLGRKQYLLASRGALLFTSAEARRIRGRLTTLGKPTR